MREPDFSELEDAIAVIGLAGRFPGAHNLTELWEIFRSGREVITFFTPEELAAAGVPPELAGRPDYVPAAALVDGIDLFDAAFFGFTPREAELLDPQHRLFLECAAHALDDAGYDPERFAGRIAVFGGAGASAYLLANLLPNPGRLAEMGQLQVMLANQPDFLCTRVSYKLNLRGPSALVQTACSTALAAAHFACQSLLAGESDMALAGGVSLAIPDHQGYLYQSDGVLSADGHCRAFDRRATGSVRGSGVGLVVLKRLPEAMIDGDTVHAVIRGSAMNNDGATKVGFTAPSVDCQAEVIAEALSMAGVDPETVTYVEAHGSGTALGDPIEVAALTRAFRQAGALGEHFCALGSAKTQMGHLNAAAGIAGLTRAILALEHRQIPPSPYFDEPNPEIDFAASPFYVPTEAVAWGEEGEEGDLDSPRRAGVSSFGLGGTNVHLILEEAPPALPRSPVSAAGRPEQLLALSARTPEALVVASRELAAHLAARPELPLADVAWTLAAGRRLFPHARAVVARDRAEAIHLLAAPEGAPGAESASRRIARGRRPQAPPPVVFLFPGLGDHYLHMARGLYEGEEVFQGHFDACAEALAPLLGADLREIVFPGEAPVVGDDDPPDMKALLRRARDGARDGDGAESEAERRLTRTIHAQPALFATEYSLARLLMSWGITPGAMIGYSIGEYVAATLAGVLSLEDALTLVARRARWIEELPPGAMLAVPLPVDEVERRLARTGSGAGERLAIAAENGPNLTVVGGTEEGVEAFRQALAGDGIAALPLAATHPFHTPLLDPVAPALTELARGMEHGELAIPYLSNATGTWITPAEAADPAGWARHMAGRVRFAAGVGELLADPKRLLLEVGPGNTLTSLARQHPAATTELRTLTTLRHASERLGDLTHLLGTVGRLWASGVEVEWEGFFAGEDRRRVRLPGYPFERRRFWVDAPAHGQLGQPSAASTASAAWVGGAVAGGVADAAPAGTGPAAPPAHPRGELTTPYRAPETAAEEALVEIWGELFGIAAIGVDDSFFDLGGHSLLGIQLMTHIRHRFDVELPLTELFEHTTVAALAGRIREVSETGLRQAFEPPPIPRLPGPDEGDFPLSSDQERLWFIHRLDPLQTAYNIDAALRLRGPVDIRAFQRSLVAVIGRHSLWRTVFPQVDGRPVARVLPLDEGCRVPVADLSGIAADLCPTDLGRLALREAHGPFDLEHGPLVRMRFLRLGPEDHLFMMTVHHIVTDWFTFHLFWSELRTFYAAFRGRPDGVPEEVSGLPELPVRYSDFVAWQAEWMQGEVLEGHLDYWMEALAPMPLVLDLPTDHPRPRRYTSKGRKAFLHITPEKADRLRALSGEEAASLFMTLLGAYGVTLMRFSGQDRMLVGTPNANRIRPEMEYLLGFFLTQIVYPVDLSGDPSFRVLIRRIRASSLASYPYAAVPFSKLVEALRPPRDTSRLPLVQTNLLLLDADFSDLSLPGIDIETLPIDDQAARFELSLALWDTLEGLIRGWVEYNILLWDPATGERIAHTFEAVLDAAIADADRPLSHLPLLPAPERHQLLVEWNDTALPAPAAGAETLPALFLARAAEAPDTLALEAGDEALSYGELARRAGSVARGLGEGVLPGAAVGAEDVVAIFCERGPEQLVAILGVSLAGAAWLPIDASYPAERVALLLADSGARALLTQGRLIAAGAVPELPGLPRVAVEELLAAAPGAASEIGEDGGVPVVPAHLVPAHLAYVIYTSGSTGRPKGVEVSHRSAAGFLAWGREAFPLAPGERGLYHSPAGFDVSVWEIWGTWSAGGTLVLTPPGRFQDPQAFVRLLAERRVAWLPGVPSQLRLLAAEAALAGAGALRHLTAAGEALPLELARTLEGSLPAPVRNLYGPTETTIIATGHFTADGAEATASAWGTVPIGRPVSGMGAWVVDRHLRPVPAGVPGELVLGGPGLARGYRGLPARTAEVFVPNPWSTAAGAGGARLYRTGDRARHLPDGRLDFAGRIDRQVKVRGVRIEPGEIEAALLGSAAVGAAAVLLRDDLPGEGARLVAYVVPAEGAGVDVEKLRTELRTTLPEAMVPSLWVTLEKLPVSAHGKLDRAALPRPDLAGSGARRAPSGWVEERLAGVWSRVLGVPSVGPEDNFFRLGGDSILSIRMVALARELGLSLEAGQIFQYQTVRELAAVAEVVAPESGQSEPISGPLPRTPMAARLFALEEAGALPSPHHHNQALLFTVPEELDPRCLAEALGHLVTLHDALRLRAPRGADGHRHLHIEKPAPRRSLDAASPHLTLAHLDVSGLPPEAARQAWARVAERAQGSLDLDRGPLGRALLVRLGGEAGGRLLVALHHLIVDGVSWRILLEDLERSYAQLASGRPVELPPRGTSLSAWAERAAELAASSELDDELALWTGALAGPSPVRLPLDLPGAASQQIAPRGVANLEGDVRVVTGQLGEKGTRSLTASLVADAASLHEMLLASLFRALGEWTRGGRILVDVESHGRVPLAPGMDLSRTVGWLTSIYPLALDIDPESDRRDVLTAVREALSRVPRYGVGYGLLRHLSGDPMIEARLAGLPQAAVSFNYLGQLGGGPPGAASSNGSGGGGFALSIEGTGPPRAPGNHREYVLDASAIVLDGELRLSLAYGPRLHREATVAGLLARWREEVEALLALSRAPGRREDLETFGWQAEDLDAIRAAIGDTLGETAG